ncbi:unnamed protein product [Parnassius apollo]|uniref:(apollo) hypothetical protein n=1 Tax=Parnassius apollo TaxID=110799 RepID=A0A8S3WCF2_PARAO|nr:unnamed protein product [Parnassius apollo]
MLYTESFILITYQKIESGAPDSGANEDDELSKDIAAGTDSDELSSEDDIILQELTNSMRRQPYLKVMEVPRVLYGKRKHNDINGEASYQLGVDCRNATSLPIEPKTGSH